MLYEMNTLNNVKSQWIENVRNLLSSSGFSGVWYCQSFLNEKWLIGSICRKLKDNFIRKWQLTSNGIKSEFGRSAYIKILSRRSLSIMRFLLEIIGCLWKQEDGGEYLLLKENVPFVMMM
jgi:hypothetical protein